MERPRKNRRGAPEAVAKRRAARALNRMFERGGADAAMDGRLLKRKRRLLKELQEGRGGQPLKAHQVLSYTTELLTMGENLTTIRKLKPLLPPVPPLTDDIQAVMRYTQQNYGFDPRAWKLMGVDIETVMNGGNGAAAPPKPRRARKSGSKKKK